MQAKNIIIGAVVIVGVTAAAIGGVIYYDKYRKPTPVPVKTVVARDRVCLRPQYPCATGCCGGVGPEPEPLAQASGQVCLRPQYPCATGCCGVTPIPDPLSRVAMDCPPPHYACGNSCCGGDQHVPAYRL
jgi:hypothetical protein